MKFLSVIQHTNPEWLGHIEDHFEGRGIRFSYFRPFAAGGRLPAVETIGDGLVLLGGGPWGAAPGDTQLPTLEAEVRLARACLMLDKFVLGIGIGAQILSLAADGTVAAGPLRFEVVTAQPVAAGALSGLMPDRYPSAIYMRDEPVPPEYALILARSEDGRVHSFQIGTRAFGFAGHPGVRRAMLEELVMEASLPPDHAAEALQRTGAVATSIEDALVGLMAGIMRTSGLAGA